MFKVTGGAPAYKSVCGGPDAGRLWAASDKG